MEGGGDAVGRRGGDLVWSIDDPRAQGCDLSGHFWAVVRAADGSAADWTYVVFDYQNNTMLEGVAPDNNAAKAVVEEWDRAVVAAWQRGEPEPQPIREDDR
jgi:hypothetical protein